MVSMLSASAAFLSVRQRAMRGKRTAMPDRCRDDRWMASIHLREVEALKNHPLKAASDAADLFLEHAKRILDQGGPRVLICAPPADLLDTFDSAGRRGESSEAELDEALVAAERHTQSFCLLEVRLDPQDRSPALQRLAERLAKNI